MTCSGANQPTSSSTSADRRVWGKKAIDAIFEEQTKQLEDFFQSIKRDPEESSLLTHTRHAFCLGEADEETRASYDVPGKALVINVSNDVIALAAVPYQPRLERQILMTLTCTTWLGIQPSATMM